MGWITYPFPNFNVQVCEWISNFILNLTIGVIFNHAVIKVNPCYKKEPIEAAVPISRKYFMWILNVVKNERQVNETPCRKYCSYQRYIPLIWFTLTDLEFADRVYFKQLPNTCHLGKFIGLVELGLTRAKLIWSKIIMPLSYSQQQYFLSLYWYPQQCCN